MMSDPTTINAELLQSSCSLKTHEAGRANAWRQPVQKPYCTPIATRVYEIVKIGDKEIAVEQLIYQLVNI